jgi:type IV pilus assembly protein PilY1
MELWDAGLELNSKTPGTRTIYFPNIAVNDVVNEAVGTGDGTATTFTGALAHQPVSATTLVITDTRESFQDKHTKDLEGSLGGVGTINRSTGEFTVTFSSPPDDGVPIRASYSYYTTSSVLLPFTLANVSNDMLGLDDTFVVPDGYVYDFDGDNDFDENDGDWLVNWIRGYRDGVSTPKEWLLGGVDHSTPAMLTAPGIPQWYYGTATTKAERDSYMTFQSVYADRQSVIFVGALDGMLHAFDAGKFRRDDNAATAGITENRGYFLWEDRTADTPVYCSATSTACPNYGTGEELWAFIPANLMPRLKNNVLQGDDRAYVDASPAVADVYIGGAWRTVLISAEGIGGDTIFCLDVTDPANPTFLWEFADPDLFRSRSSPSVAKIGRILRNGTAKWVAFFVSGKTYDATLYPSIYMIDIADGSVVERIFLHGHVDGIGGVPSGQPTVIDSDANGYIDRLYIGTDKGFLYKINIPDDPDTVKYGISTCVINTDFTDENAFTVPLDQRLHPIYGSPLAVVENSISTEGTIDYDVRIFFGTGDSPYYDEDINMAATRYYFFAYRDQTKKGQCDDSKVFLDWAFELPEGHRIYSSAFAAAGNIYFGTSTAETEDPCEVSESTALYGLGNLYAFSMDGTKKFEKAVGNSFIAPVVIDKHLYFKSQTAEIQSFGAGVYNNKTIISGFPDIDLKFWREIY